jgi:hypothetical protein
MTGCSQGGGNSAAPKYTRLQYLQMALKNPGLPPDIRTKYQKMYDEEKLKSPNPGN